MAHQARPPRYLLITRPYQDSLKLAEKIERFGYHRLIEPLFDLKTYDRLQMPPLKTCPQACIITSKNAAFALTHYRIDFSTPIFTVGPKSTQAVQSLGYHEIFEAPGTAASIPPLLRQHLNPHHGDILYLSGHDIRFDFLTCPELALFKIVQRVVYEMWPRARLSQRTVSAIYAQQVPGVLLYSPKTARHLLKLALDFKLSFKHCTAYCLSTAIAQVVSQHFKDVIEIDCPNEDLLLKHLKVERDHD